jgi:hypothetical protein
MLRSQTLGSLPVTGCVNLIAGFTQRSLQKILNLNIVFNEQ